jgi:hypothetical protein
MRSSIQTATVRPLSDQWSNYWPNRASIVIGVFQCLLTLIIFYLSFFNMFVEKDGSTSLITRMIIMVGVFLSGNIRPAIRPNSTRQVQLPRCCCTQFSRAVYGLISNILMLVCSTVLIYYHHQNYSVKEIIQIICTSITCPSRVSSKDPTTFTLAKIQLAMNSLVIVTNICYFAVYFYTLICSRMATRFPLKDRTIAYNREEDTATITTPAQVIGFDQRYGAVHCGFR